MVGQFELASIRVEGLCSRVVAGKEFEEILFEVLMLCESIMDRMEPLVSLGRDDNGRDHRA